jgi:hypothetical protein
MDDERILTIAKSKGEFRVSLRWRDDKLRARCYRLRKEGKLRGGYKIIHGAKIFYPKEVT